MAKPDRGDFAPTSAGWWDYSDACVQYLLRHSERRVGTDLLADQGAKWIDDREWGPATRCLGLALEQIHSAAMGGPYRAPNENVDEPIVLGYNTALLMALAEHPDFAVGLQADAMHKINLLESMTERGFGRGYRTGAKELRRRFTNPDEVDQVLPL
ncbi:MAG: hypothetical protein ACR2QE_04920 [Acidimicrobiales bacterium]